MGKYTLSLNTVMNESNATVFGGRALPSYKLNFTIKGWKNHQTFSAIFIILPECPDDKLMLFFFVSEGHAESFVAGAVSMTIDVGVPFDIPLHIKDGYDHPAIPPPNLKPSLQCRWIIHFIHTFCFVNIP